MTDDINSTGNNPETQDASESVQAQASAPEAFSEPKESLASDLDDAAADSEHADGDWTVPAVETIHTAPPKKKGLTVATAVLAVAIVAVLAVLIFRITGKLGGGTAEPETTAGGTQSAEGGDTREYTIDDYEITGKGNTSSGATNAQGQAQAQEDKTETHVAVAGGTIVVSNVQYIGDSGETTIIYNNVPLPGEATGVNRISDEPTNRFIQIVADKYSVDPDLLVAIYPENYDGSESDDNFVLQFNGTRDSNGKVVRSPDTLEIVYKVDSEKNVVVNKKVGVAGQLVFSMVTELIMPQHPDYFTGVG